jgi:hypothetical protein
MIHYYFFIINFSSMVVQLNKIHEYDFIISEIEFETLFKILPTCIMFFYIVKFVLLEYVKKNCDCFYSFVIALFLMF